MEIITYQSQATKQAGKLLGQEILKTKANSKQALIFALQGDLGGGKTTFIQGMAQGLDVQENITSPTFVIMKKYDIKRETLNIKHLYHIDCYRIASQDLLALGFNEIINFSENLVVIEWAERVKNILPKNIFWIKFKYLDKDKRKIKIKNFYESSSS